jgi:hypothetical protein
MINFLGAKSREWDGNGAMGQFFKVFVGDSLIKPKNQ